MAFEDIKELLAAKRYVELKERIKELQIPDIAEFIDELDTKNAIIAFRLLPKEIAADVFPIFPPSDRAKYPRWWMKRIDRNNE